jgi:ribosome biogenesis GTPase
MKGKIIKSTGSWYQVMEFGTDKIFEARIRGKFKLIKTRLTNPLAVGDFVEFQLEQDDVAWITKIDPRTNYLIRKSVNLSKRSSHYCFQYRSCLLYVHLKAPRNFTRFSGQISRML